MAKRHNYWTRKLINRRLADGRGKGTGSNYQPWLRVQDVPSKGRIHRIKGCTTGRVHHLLSDLEAKVFYTFDYSPSVCDIREQFPLLPLEETLAIAEECGVAHPADPMTRHPIVMTTDLLVTRHSQGSSVYEARTIKYESELKRPRVLEKLEIERRYWKRRNIDWGIIRECDIHQPLIDNIRWIRPYFDITDLYPLTEGVIRQIGGRLTHYIRRENTPLCEIAIQCDAEFGLLGGSSLAVVRHLLATKQWRVDMDERIQPGEKLVLLEVQLRESD
jgi:TnsA-like endonuclease N terminal/TnsA endonuclease C terminal